MNKRDLARAQTIAKREKKRINAEQTAKEREIVLPPVLVVPRRERGRPSLYEPQYCEMVEELARCGLSKYQIAGRLDVSVVTLEEWAKMWPEFAVAIARARNLSLMWWEDVGQKGVRDRFFNAYLWSRSMGARFPNEYRESKHVDVSVEVNVSERLLAARKRISG